MKYCLDCEWSVSDGTDFGGIDRRESDPAERDREGADAAEADADDPSGRAIAHAAETGHSIESDGPPFPRALLDRNNPDLSQVLPVTPRRDRCGLNG
ncbi:hypothetical protein [Halorarum salinum]|uniref:Uncharacterized protein n=1 Tax=Halorarum salinum TaxID=2743089 RepID=A0A7D5QCL0_9EURY|nr:hypothetical protein [Halobaculum salinum]QLG64276.1 hypothetical protein HUG12_21065 [Halobaculum salinum]